MSSKLSSVTLGAAIIAAGVIGASIVRTADADRVVQPSEMGIATVDVFELIDQIVLGQEQVAARVSFDAQQQQRLQQMQGAYESAQQQLQAADPADPGSAAIYGQVQQLGDQLNQAYQTYQADMQSLLGNQIADAYAQVHDAARIEATEQGYTFVFATRPESSLTQRDTISGVAQEILSRPLIAPPASVDLTESIRVRLGLPDPDAVVPDAEPVIEPVIESVEPDATTEGDEMVPVPDSED